MRQDILDPFKYTRRIQKEIEKTYQAFYRKLARVEKS
jgi:uncharacterized Fe-S cluster-containing radical SAM superfamily enzyme